MTDPDGTDSVAPGLTNPETSGSGWTDLGSPGRHDETIESAGEPQGMIPARTRRRTGFERVSMRILATGGIIGIAVALGAILVSKSVDGWIVGLVVGLTSVTLAAVLWSSRQL